jgi:iron(III) transport system ATP-binding protein
LLLDEPFNGLDPCLRDSVREHTRMLCASQRIPVMLVTHDPREALGLADTVVILRDGAVVQSASPAEIRRNPASAYVLTFLEQQLNTYSGYIRDRQAYTPFGLIPAPANDDCPARVYVRPDAFSLTTDAAALAGTLRSCRFADDRHFLEVELDGQPGGSLVTIQAPRDFAAPKDALVRFRIDPEQIFVFPV